MSQRTDRQMDSVFEEQIMAALQERGYQVHPQVGIAGSSSTSSSRTRRFPVVTFSASSAMVPPIPQQFHILTVAFDGIAVDRGQRCTYQHLSNHRIPHAVGDKPLGSRNQKVEGYEYECLAICPPIKDMRKLSLRSQFRR